MTTETAPKNHPLFEAHVSHQWTGRLADLLPRLVPEAKRNPGPFAWRVLPRGAVVGVRINPEHMRPELRIARAEPPETQEQDARWQNEIGVFLKHFGIIPVDGKTPADGHNYWLELPDDPEDEGKAAARWLQLRKGETEPGKAVCHRCRKAGVARPVEWFPGTGPEGQACNRHAIEAGREHTAEVRARLGLT